MKVVAIEIVHRQLKELPTVATDTTNREAVLLLSPFCEHPHTDEQ